MLKEVARLKSLAAMLVEAKLITEQQWESATLSQRGTGQPIGKILVERKLITPYQLAFFTSLHTGIPLVNLKRLSFVPEVLNLVTEKVARKYEAIPLELVNKTLRVAMSDPGNVQHIADLEAFTNHKIEPMVSTSEDIRNIIDHNYRASGEIEKQLRKIPLQSRSDIPEARLSAESIAGAPIVRAIDLLITQAVTDRASDIHLDPQEDGLRIRYRIDGILHDIMNLPLRIYPSLISRLKIMAGMNIAERRRPQDGQITFRSRDKDIDIRVATSNTVYGEMAVLRLLDKTFAFRALPQLGFLPETLEKYRHMLRTPFGMIMISGPTGSGKTTTLYASLNTLDSVATNIYTIEDPVEYRFKNICQTQVNPGANLTFATGLRAALRLDPDVILVGEIRDAETAQIAIQAALTGHLVLSSVHANDTAGVIFRLIDLGVERFLIGSAVIAVVAQRMVRCICAHCSRPVRANAEERLAFEQETGEDRTEFLYGSGCTYCANTGYHGRTAIFEIMVVSEAIRRLIVSNASADDIRAQANKEGLVTLWRDGMTKIKMGVTTPYEVIRNVYSI